MSIYHSVYTAHDLIKKKIFLVQKFVLVKKKKYICDKIYKLVNKKNSMAKSYSEKIIATKLMIDGIKEHKDSLPHGVSIDIATKMEELRSKIETLNSEQESLKAELKRKTDTITKEFQELDKIYNDAKKRIKLDVEQTLWRKFGIEDKK